MALNYVGNQDFRGWLEASPTYNSKSSSLLKYVGNDGKVDPTKLDGGLNNNGTYQFYGQQAADLYGQYQQALSKDAADRQAAETAAKTARDQADEQAYWDDQISQADSSIGRLGNQKAVGYGNLDSSYQSALTGLTNQNAAAKNRYETTRTRTTQDNIQNRANIDTGVRNQLTGIQRLLGARGAGGGSAATIVAPYAAAIQGNQRRQQVQQAYGRNINDLDNNWNEASTAFQSSLGQLDTDRDNKRRELDAGFADTEAGLLGAKSDAAVRRGQAGGQTYVEARNARTPYTSRIQQLLGQIDDLGRNISFQPKAVTYNDPSLQAYNYDKFAAPAAGQVDPSLAQGTGAYWNLLQGSDPKKKQLQLQ